jgi:hypothetical protein
MNKREVTQSLRPPYREITNVLEIGIALWLAVSSQQATRSFFATLFPTVYGRLL